MKPKKTFYSKNSQIKAYRIYKFSIQKANQKKCFNIYGFKPETVKN